MKTSLRNYGFVLNVVSISFYNTNNIHVGSGPVDVVKMGA